MLLSLSSLEDREGLPRTNDTLRGFDFVVFLQRGGGKAFFSLIVVGQAS